MVKQIKLYKKKRTYYKTAYGAEWMEMRYMIKKKNGMSQKTFDSMVKKLVKKIPELKNKYFFVDSMYGHGWRTSEMNTDTENIDVYDPNRYYDTNKFKDNVYQFSIIYARKPNHQGGNDKNNNCFWKCLLKAYNGAANIPHFHKPWSLKKRLGLKVDAKISVDDVKKIEDIIECKVNIIGDTIYQSIKPYTREITVKLENEHYTLRENDSAKELVRGQSHEEKDIMVYSMDNVTGDIKTYSKDGEGVITLDNFIEYRNKPITSKYILLRYAPKNDETMQEFYESFMKDAIEIRDITEGKMNLLMCGKDKLCAFKLFHDFSRTINPDHIDENEAFWLDKGMSGGLMYAFPVYLKHGYSYDMNSMYPAMYLKGQYPIKKGEFIKIQNLEEIVEYGIYRCVIHKSGNDNIDKLFRFKHRFVSNGKYYDYYTHADIKSARKKGLKIELIMDDQPNCLRYVKGTRLSGKNLFGRFVEFLYPFKKDTKYQHLKTHFKMFLNVLWGAFMEKTTILARCGKHYPLQTKKIPKTITPNGDNYLVEYEKEDETFKTSYARFGCFITSFAREYISDVMEKYSPYIYRIHTDGFITDRPIDIELSEELGKFKNDKQGECLINYVNVKDSVLWNEDIKKI